MSETLVISDADVARIADAVVQRMSGAPTPVEKISATFQEVKQMLGAPSDKATQRRIKRLGVKPYSRGLYRVRDFENAIARRTRT